MVITNLVTVDGIQQLTDTGNDSFNTGKLVLDQINGAGLTQGAVRLEAWDRIRIRITNLITNVIVYNKVFDIEQIQPTISDTGGHTLTLILVGIEHWLDKKHFSQPGRFLSAFEIVKRIGDQYNASRGSDMPQLLDHDNTTGNTLPKYTINNYDFGRGQYSCWTRILEVIDKLGGAVENGGVLDFFDMRFDYDATDPNKIYIRIFSSGNPAGSGFQTLSTTTAPVVRASGALEGEKATVINVYGADTAGSLPIEWAKFRSGQEYFLNHPEWQTGVLYKVDARVQRQGLHYKCLIEHTSSVPFDITKWTTVSDASEFGNVYQYSPWTVDKAVTIWKNSGADPLGTQGFYQNPAMLDANIEVWDTASGEEFFRTWVDVRVKSDADIPLDYLYAKNLAGVYRGFRVLVDTTLGAAGGAFAGNDYKGDPFANAVAEYDGLNQRWFVKYLPINNLHIAVLHQADIYKYSGASWSRITNTAGQADCFHPYFSISNVPGIIQDALFPANNNSAVEVEYRYDSVSDSVNPGNKNYYSIGAWLSLRFPIPVFSGNGIGEYVGQLYGGGTPLIGTSVKEPALFDIQNNHYTPTGKTGWNEGDESERLGQCSAIKFFIKLTYESSIDQVNYVRVQLTANFKMRCALVDINGNVVVQDFNIERNGDIQEVTLPFSAFVTYRGRQPKDITDIFIPPKELDVSASFQFHQIKMVLIQTQDSYDDNGRYDATILNLNNRWVIGTILAFPKRRIRLWLDGFHFVKPLIANSGKDTLFG